MGADPRAADPEDHLEALASPSGNQAVAGFRPDPAKLPGQFTSSPNGKTAASGHCLRLRRSAGAEAP